MENMLERKYRLDKVDAKSVVSEAKRTLGMSKSTLFSEPLKAECLRICEENGYIKDGEPTSPEKKTTTRSHCQFVVKSPRRTVRLLHPIKEETINRLGTMSIGDSEHTQNSSCSSTAPQTAFLDPLQQFMGSFTNKNSDTLKIISDNARAYRASDCVSISSTSTTTSTYSDASSSSNWTWGQRKENEVPSSHHGSRRFDDSSECSSKGSCSAPRRPKRQDSVDNMDVDFDDPPVSIVETTRPPRPC